MMTLVVCTGVETGFGNSIELVALFSAAVPVQIIITAMQKIEIQKSFRESLRLNCDKLDVALSERSMPQAPSLVVSPSGSIEIEQADFGW